MKALIFDSFYDEFRGVVAYVRVFDGEILAKQKYKLIATKTEVEPPEVGYVTPTFRKSEKISEGDVGYVITGL